MGRPVSRRDAPGDHLLPAGLPWPCDVCGIEIRGRGWLMAGYEDLDDGDPAEVFCSEECWETWHGGDPGQVVTP